ncbi:hypothetical protein RB195_014535 [Necator americanus]
MTTITAAIFCYLTNTSEFLLNNRTISTEEYYRRFCLDQNDMTYDEVHNTLGSSRVEYAVVRDPVERFLSGFVDKCINEAKKNEQRCFGCKGDMNCFVEKMYSVMLAAQRANSSKYDYELAHFAPQTWYCNFKDNFHYYTTVSYEEGFDGILNLAKNHEMIYEKAGVPEELRRTIYTELLGVPSLYAGNCECIRHRKSRQNL